MLVKPTWSPTRGAAGPLRFQQDRSSKRASREHSFLHEYLSFTSGPGEDTVTLHSDISLRATQTQSKDSNLSQLPHCLVSLAAVFVTPSRRTLPRRAAAWLQKSQPRGLAETALTRVSVATRAAVSGGGGRGGRG